MSILAISFLAFDTRTDLLLGQTPPATRATQALYKRLSTAIETLRFSVTVDLLEVTLEYVCLSSSPLILTDPPILAVSGGVRTSPLRRRRTLQDSRRISRREGVSHLLPFSRLLLTRFCSLWVSDIACTSLHSLRAIDVKKGETLAIWGMGPVGLFAAQWAKLAGVERIIVIDDVVERLAFAEVSLFSSFLFVLCDRVLPERDI